MKKILATMMALALTIAAQAERIDSTQFVAFYNYTIQTQDDEGQNVTDSIRLALLVGTRATYCTTVLSYNKDGRASQEMLDAFSMHFQNVLTDVEKSSVVAVEPIYPYRYETHEPMAKVDWTLTEDTLTISGLPGLIIKAEDAEGIHCFTLYETKNEVIDINMIGSPEYQKLSRKKLMDFKKKTLGNPRYPKEPTYYVPEGADEVLEVNVNGTFYSVGYNSHMMILQKSHVYKPLELE